MMKNQFNFLVFVCVIFYSSASYAQNVSSPSIKEGKLVLNNRIVFSEKDGNHKWDMKNRFQYGVSDRWALTFAGEFEKQEDQSAKMDKVEFRAMYLMTDKMSFAETALRGVYDVGLIGNSDSVGLEFIGRKKVDKWSYLFNLDTAHDVGENANDGVDLDLAFAAYHSFGDFRLGGEYYWDFGNLKNNNGYSEQSHQLGPAIVFDPPFLGEGVKMEAAYFAGISDAAKDHTLKYELDITF